jgi:hypothetical protein
MLYPVELGALKLSMNPHYTVRHPKWKEAGKERIAASQRSEVN